MTTTVIKTKISEVENKIANVRGLVKKTDYDAKISNIVGKYITTSNDNEFTSDILDVKIKQKELVNKSNISNLVKNSDLNTKLAKLATKAELKAKQDKIVKLQAFDSSNFHDKNFFTDEGIQNIFFIKQHLICQS